MNKNMKKMIIPFAALAVIVADSLGYNIAQEDIQNILNGILGLLAALGIISNNDKV